MLIFSMTPTLDQHFKNKDSEVRIIFNKILTQADQLGPYEIDPKKTAIYLRGKSVFLGIYLRKSYLYVSFIFAKKKRSDYFLQIGKISKNRYRHQIRVTTKTQIDRTFLKYLKESYELMA